MSYQKGRKAAGQSNSSEQSFVSAPAISLPGVHVAPSLGNRIHEATVPLSVTGIMRRLALLYGGKAAGLLSEHCAYQGAGLPAGQLTNL